MPNTDTHCPITVPLEMHVTRHIQRVALSIIMWPCITCFIVWILSWYYPVVNLGLKRYNVFLDSIFFSSSRESFKKLSKTDPPFRFCRIGLNYYVKQHVHIYIESILLVHPFMVVLFSKFLPGQRDTQLPSGLRDSDNFT